MALYTDDRIREVAQRTLDTLQALLETLHSVHEDAVHSGYEKRAMWTENHIQTGAGLIQRVSKEVGDPNP